MRTQQQGLIAAWQGSQKNLRPVTVAYEPAVVFVIVFFYRERIAFDCDAFKIRGMTVDVIEGICNRECFQPGERHHKPCAGNGKPDTNEKRECSDADDNRHHRPRCQGAMRSHDDFVICNGCCHCCSPHSSHLLAGGFIPGTATTKKPGTTNYKTVTSCDNLSHLVTKRKLSQLPTLYKQVRFGAGCRPIQGLADRHEFDRRMIIRD
jgi:hypothetical protein